MTIGPVAVAALEPTQRFHDIPVPLSVKLCMPVVSVGNAPIAGGRAGGAGAPRAPAPRLDPAPPLDPDECDPLLDPDECAPLLPAPLLPVPPLPPPLPGPLLPVPLLEPFPDPESSSETLLPGPTEPPGFALDEPQ